MTGGDRKRMRYAWDDQGKSLNEWTLYGLKIESGCRTANDDPRMCARSYQLTNQVGACLALGIQVIKDKL